MPQDRLLYFNQKAKGEAIRMLHALADKPLTDEVIEKKVWPVVKSTTPLGQVPVYTTAEGDVLVLSNTIARYLAKKFGMMGSTLIEEALNDMVLETCVPAFSTIGPKVYFWKVFKSHPVPENKEEILAEVRADILKAVNYIQTIAEKRGNKFIVSDTISLADVWLYCSLEFSKECADGAMEVTPWVKEFVEKFTSDERVKKYLATRPTRRFTV